MSFLDNSGDIILDAVLTDAGRARLAQGDGSFKIVKYAFADDEIDYSKYQNANYVDGANTSGSAYYDINILRTPVLEAFTNNTSTMKSKLVSIPQTNLLYLPVIELCDGSDFAGGSTPMNNNNLQATGSYIVGVDQTTDDALGPIAGQPTIVGYFRGFEGDVQTKNIVVHQGLDTTAISPSSQLDTTLVETQFIVEMDNRLGSLSNPSGQIVSFSFLDDDNIATYNISNTSQGSAFFVNAIGTNALDSPIAGPRGVGFAFKLKPSIELQTSTFLFERIGTTGQSFANRDGTYAHIDTIVRITGATTGYRLDIPVRYIKQTSAS
tara:strand:- start:3020 stop:3988 length:969 start_codon:yes stop_codon:yes gene_type:complete